MIICCCYYSFLRYQYFVDQFLAHLKTQMLSPLLITTIHYCLFYLLYHYCVSYSECLFSFHKLRCRFDQMIPAKYQQRELLRPPLCQCLQLLLLHSNLPSTIFSNHQNQTMEYYAEHHLAC